MKGLRTLLALGMLAIAACAQARVTVERVEYRGWRDSYLLTAGDYALVVVPEIGGRIMEYSFKGENALWINPSESGRTYPLSKEWRNYGGAKLWISPQDSWGWPPSPMLDHGKANVEVRQAPSGVPTLVVTGCPDLDAGVVFRRYITLEESGDATIRNEVVNISGDTVRHGIWDVTQTPAPCFVAFPVKKGSRFADGISFITSESRNSRQFNVRDGLCTVSYRGEVGKIGSDSDGPWMIWFKGTTAFVKLLDPMKKGAEYPDGGCSVQVFTREPQYGYVEMETMGPIQSIAPGKSAEMTERWRILKLSQPVKDENWVYKSVKGMRGKGWIP